MALNNVPLAGQTLAVTRNPINQNFATINTGFAINHIEYNLADQGKHKFLQMPEQLVAPNTAPNEAGLYSAVGAYSGATEISFKRESNGAVIPFTECLAAANGWTNLPSGILMKWGTVNANDNVDVVHVFPVAANIPVFTAVYSINVSMVGTAAVSNNGNWDLFVSGLNILGFTTYVNTNKVQNRNIYYSVIGV